MKNNPSTPRSSGRRALLLAAVLFAIGAVGVKMCHDWLPRAVEHGSDIVARSYMMAAAIMGSSKICPQLGMPRLVVRMIEPFR